MKRKMLLLVGVCLVMACASSAFAAVSLKRLGQHPFSQPAMTTEAELRAMVENRSADIQIGFNQAGHPELYPEFMAQFPNAKIEMIQVAPGEQFDWMMFRTNGVGPVKVIRDVTWNGEEAFDAFSFHIDMDAQRYDFIVAAICGNLALKGITAVPEVVNQNPVCVMTLSSTEVKCGQTITVDASGSTDSDGAISQVVFRMLDSSNQVVEEKIDKEAPFVQELTVPCGESKYSVQAVVVDDKGAQSSPAECMQTVTAIQRKGGPVADVGIAHQFDPATWAFARVGYELPLTGDLYVMGLIGGFVLLDDDNDEFDDLEDADDAFTADLLLNYYINEKLFVGGGVGYWSGNDGEADLIVNMGYLVHEIPGKLKTSIFIEGRCLADELVSSNASRLGLGVRFQF